MNQAKPTPSHRSTALLFVLAVAAIAAGVAVNLLSAKKAANEPPASNISQSQTHASVLATPRPLPDMALLDHTGEPFGRSQLAGRWNLLFFGFTHCPDVCPTTLSDMKRLRRKLQDLPGAQQPGIVFISVDPERDTPQALAAYLAFFDAGATGVTGTRANIEELTRKLGVAVAFVSDGSDNGYTVDHTAALFAVNPNAELAAIFVPPHDLQHMAADWRTIIEGHDR